MMSKPCKLCSSPQNIQDSVVALRDEGASHRKIEAELKSLFDFNIASSSIGHHLNKCLQSQTENSMDEGALCALEELAEASPDNDTTRHALRNLLAKAIVKFDLKMAEEKQASPNIHLETVRCLEILVNIQEKLYAQKQEPGEENSFREKSLSVLSALTEEEKRALITQDRP